MEGIDEGLFLLGETKLPKFSSDSVIGHKKGGFPSQEPLFTLVELMDGTWDH